MKSLKYAFAAFLSLLFVVTMGACAANTADTDGQTQPATTVAVYVTHGGSAVQFRLPDGTSGSGWEDYRDAMARYYSDHDVQDLAIQLSDVPLFGVSLQNPPLKPEWQGAVGNYYVRVVYKGSKWVNCSCFSKQGAVVNLAVSKLGVNDPIADLHLISWSENGRVCFGAYMSGAVKNWCAKICSPTYKDVKNALYSAFLSAGITASVAIILSEIAAPATMAALAI